MSFKNIIITVLKYLLAINCPVLQVTLPCFKAEEQLRWAVTDIQPDRPTLTLLSTAATSFR